MPQAHQVHNRHKVSIPGTGMDAIVGSTLRAETLRGIFQTPVAEAGVERDGSGASG
jgi:hypothetical protein